MSCWARVVFGRCQATMAAAIVVAATTASSLCAQQPPKASTFTLVNGMQVVVIPDHRTPVVTHMVWYRVGAADDPFGKSGLAHFLEHLMFKATRTLKTGEFTRIVNRLGGRHNALTAHDTTAYFQRTAKEHLGRLMEIEADRMVHLTFDPVEVRTERDVVIEERRSTVDASPVAVLNEQMLAALYQNHPYRRPVLGWAHEIAALDHNDAAAFYARHYSVGNSVLVVAGDISEAELRVLAERTYGRHRPMSVTPPRQRPREPDHAAARRVHVEDPRTGEPLLLRYYHVPSLATAEKSQAAALVVLARILGGDDTSRLYRRLVLELQLAVQSGADYQSVNLDSGRLAVLALAAKDKATADLEKAMDEVLVEIVANGVTPDELMRAKSSLEAEHVFESDNQEKRARRYGEGLAVGRALADIETDHMRVMAVTADDVKKAAATHLQLGRSVTGLLSKPANAKR